MSINPFKLERYFALHEFSAKYLLSSSDCESLSLAEVLQMASPENLTLWKNLRLGYTESAGHPLLREAVSNGYAQIKPEQVLIAVPEEAIYICMHTLLRPGDHVVAIAPAYQSLHEVARSLGCRLSTWELEPTSTGWKLDLDKLEASLEAQTRLLVINFPNNPTGFLPTRQEFAEIIALARKKDLLVFSDEMYRLLELDPALRLPALCDVYEKGISLSGLSKSFALPGLRVGWLATRQTDLLAGCLEYKDYTTICGSAPSEILAIIALQNSANILARNLEIIRANLRLAEQFFQKHAARVSWTSPLAGSIAFPEWIGAQSVEDFCQAALAQQGLMIVPGSLFDHPGRRFRIGLGRKNFAKALEHLDEFLSARA